MRGVELNEAGIHSETLARMVNDQTITRVARGLYQLVDAEETLWHELAEIAKLAPKGVICLVTALQYHKLTLQIPSYVWLAIDSKARKPKIDYPPVRIARFGPQSLYLGVQTYDIDAVSVPITNPAKAVVDCFRFRQQIGLNIALEGLHNAIQSGKAKPTQIAEYSQATRIWSVIRPYLETVVAIGT